MFKTVSDKMKGRGSAKELKASDVMPIDAPKESLIIKPEVETEIKARFKIELTFGPNRTIHGPNVVGVQIWESGKMLNGGGDALAFWCKDVAPESNAGCWSVIPASRVRNDGIAICLKCGMALNSSRLTNLRIFKLTTKKLSEVLSTIFYQLEGSADIYVKFHMTDIRYQAMLKDKGLAVARKLKGMHIYPLKNILKDTTDGATLSDKLEDFLTA